MLPMLQKEVVEKRGWATEEELADYYAIGQCTPGIIAVNTATFIGYRQAGIAVQYAFEGIRVCVCVLILDAVQKLWKKSVIDQPTLAIFLAVFLISSSLAVVQSFIPDMFSISPIVYVVVAGVAGVILHGGKGKKEAGK